MPAANLACRDRLAEDAVGFLNQLPGAAIGHAHGAPGGRDRAETANLLQQLDLPGADSAFGIKVDAKA